MMSERLNHYIRTIIPFPENEPVSMFCAYFHLKLLTIKKSWCYCCPLEEHAYQQFIECAFDSQGQVDHTWRYGYDGKDIMHVDLVKKAVVATSEPGKMLEEERKHMEYIKRKEEKLKMVCSAVKTVFLKSNNSLSRAGKFKQSNPHCQISNKQGC